jgi:thiamine biosynthesis lipoprotein
MSPEAIATTFPAMGGTIELQLVGGSAGDANRLKALFADHERTMSRFLPESELCALNRTAPAPFAASALLFEAVSEALGWACVTDGVFDPTVIDVLEASGYDRPFEHIAGGGAVATAVRTRTERGRWRGIDLDVEHNIITMPAGMRIDLGGIGKGYSVDRAIAALGPRANAMVNASGDLYAAGDGPEGDGWYVGVQDPFAMAQDIAVLNINDCAVATSGSIKRRWTVGDTRYHHLIDPREGRSAASDLITVTVVAPTATQADVLAKTAFLLGGGEGLRAIERFDGAECIAVTTSGDVLATRGMPEYYA